MDRDYNNNQGGVRSGGGSRGGGRWSGDQRPQQFQNTGRGGGGDRGGDGGRGPHQWGPRRQRRPPPPQYGDQRPQQYGEGSGLYRERGGGGGGRGPPLQRSSRPILGMIIYFISLLFICMMGSVGPGYEMLKWWLSEIGTGVVTQCYLSGPANDGRDQHLPNLAIKITAKLGRYNINFLLKGQC